MSESEFVFHWTTSGRSLTNDGDVCSIRVFDCSRFWGYQARIVEKQMQCGTRIPLWTSTGAGQEKSFLPFIFKLATNNHPQAWQAAFVVSLKSLASERSIHTHEGAPLSWPNSSLQDTLCVYRRRVLQGTVVCLYNMHKTLGKVFFWFFRH